MSTQACMPCAKRKVRCDRADPCCSNCKRRKQDKCVYPELSPNDRIKRLEALVRSLGGDPEDDPQTAKERLDAATASVQTNSSARPDGGWIWYGSIKNPRDGLKPYLTGEGEGKTYVESYVQSSVDTLLNQALIEEVVTGVHGEDGIAKASLTCPRRLPRLLKSETRFRRSRLPVYCGALFTVIQVSTWH